MSEIVVVRRFGSGVHHIAKVDHRIPAVQFGARYDAPPAETRALCGVHLKHAVVMPESAATCRPCKFLLMAEELHRKESPE